MNSRMELTLRIQTSISRTARLPFKIFRVSYQGILFLCFRPLGYRERHLESIQRIDRFLE